MNNILVSVICTAYNQEKYIRQCLDSFIMQETNFKFEVLINDDASTDETANIIREYEQKYPDIIKPIYQAENQYSKGVSNWTTHLFPNIKGKYVAFCEGDDYWIDPYKLQKQFDFMETNPEYTICTHIVRKVYEPPILPEEIVPKDAFSINYTNITFNDILKGMYFHTSSTFFRWKAVDDVGIPKGVKNGDSYLLALYAKYGKVKLLPEIMSVYRCNPNGVYAGNNFSSSSIEFNNKVCLSRLSLFKLLYYNIATDKEWYFKEVLYPYYTFHQFYLLISKNWKIFFALTYKNADIYLLLLKHWRVIPGLIYKDVYRLVKKLFKVPFKKTN